MENDNKREENNEIITGGMEENGTVEQQERDSDNQYQPIPRPPSNRKRTRDEQHDRKPFRLQSRSKSRSKSRSRSRLSRPSQRKQWSSANAFLNFMQDFRQNCTINKVKSKDLFRLGGKAWRQMSSAEKMPYVEAAKLAQQQSQQNNKHAQQDNKSVQQNKPNGSDSSKKLDDQKDQKKKEREERRKRRRSGNRRDDSDAESDSATSGTGATMTSEDISDLSS